MIDKKFRLGKPLQTFRLVRQNVLYTSFLYRIVFNFSVLFSCISSCITLGLEATISFSPFVCCLPLLNFIFTHRLSTAQYQTSARQGTLRSSKFQERLETRLNKLYSLRKFRRFKSAHWFMCKNGISNKKVEHLQFKQKGERGRKQKTVKKCRKIL